MTDKLSSNPFAALFSTQGEAEDFIRQNGENSSNSEDIYNHSSENMILSCLEHIFLITLEEESAKKPGIVYFDDFKCPIGSELDESLFRQVVFQRVISDGQDLQFNQDSHPPETRPLYFLFQCYTRLRSQAGKFCTNQTLELCESVIVMNSSLLLIQPELVSTQNIPKQFVDIYSENFSPDSGGTTKSLMDFLDKVLKDLEINHSEETINDAFLPILEHIHSEFQNNKSDLFNPSYRLCLNCLMLFTRRSFLAKVFLNYIQPKNKEHGKSYESTLLGEILSLSCIPEKAAETSRYFMEPSSSTKEQHSYIEQSLWLPLSEISHCVYDLLLAIIKLSPESRDSILTWLANCLHANYGRGQIWSSEVPQLAKHLYVSDGFMLNLCSVMLRMCQPFSTPQNVKLLKIQPSYTGVIPPTNDKEFRCKFNMHMIDLHKETCFIPRGGEFNNEVYNFITECFFLTHYSLKIGFHCIYNNFIKLTENLHQIEGIYTEALRQAQNFSEPIADIKEHMEKGLGAFLSFKAALSEPQFLDLMFDYLTATCTWLVHLASSPSSDHFEPVKFPLSCDTLNELAYIPEFVAENIATYFMYLHRFKDVLFETRGENIKHLMTYILVFMGSSNHMKNPHLRAELSQILAALLPNSGSQNLGHHNREELFENHALLYHVSEVLISVFVSIELTGQNVEFEQKFNYRRPMYQVLEFITQKDAHRKAIEDLSRYAEDNIDASDAPLFLRFINLLMNDAIFLIDEVLMLMATIKEKESEKESGSWNDLSHEQRQENESNLRHTGMLARYHNIMGNSTVSFLELLTGLVPSIFSQPVIVQRIADMLNHFLLNLVGPKQKNLKVRNKKEFEFQPEEIVLNIMKIYTKLGRSDSFGAAVVADGRSFSHELFDRAVNVLNRISCSHELITEFYQLSDRLKAIKQVQTQEEILLADTPDEFLDPLLGTLMRDPVLLPTSKTIMDRIVLS